VVSKGTAPCILKLGTRWRWMVSFMPWSLYPWGKSPRYPLDKRLGWGAPELVWTWWWREKNTFPIPVGKQTPIIQPVALSLYWPSYPGSPCLCLLIQSWTPVWYINWPVFIKINLNSSPLYFPNLISSIISTCYINLTSATMWGPEE
jgi:hypothetical protein